MKNILLCLFLLAFSLRGIQGQGLRPPDSTKYRINLPPYWQPGNKIWQILVDKLPLVCEELKDKDLCGDNCNPRYFIEFEMSAPLIFSYTSNHISSDYTNTQYRKPSDNWDIITWYGFDCYLLLLDEKNNLLTKFVLVDRTEMWSITHRITLPSYSPPPAQLLFVRRNWAGRNGTTTDNNANQAILPVVGQEGQTPYSYINVNKEKLSPGNNDLFLVIDRKIKSW